MRQSETLSVQIEERLPELAGVGTYLPSDYSLVYWPTSATETGSKRSETGLWRQTGTRVFVTAGLVTLTFDGLPLVFTEFDAYANEARWKERQIAWPTSRASGALLLADNRLEDDRMSLRVDPSFEVDRMRKVIRIRFAEENGETFEIGTGLYA